MMDRSGRLPDVKARRQWIVKSIGRGKAVLELGCGTGDLGAQVRAKNNEVYALDINPQAVSAAQQKGLMAKESDLNEGIPFQDASFDAIFGDGILECIYDTKHLFQECHRVLKSNGLLIFSAPNINSLRNRWRILSGAYAEGLGVYPDDHSGHIIRSFNYSKITELARLTGFEVLEVKGATLNQDQSLLLKTLKPLSRYYPRFASLLLMKFRKLQDGNLLP